MRGAVGLLGFAAMVLLGDARPLLAEEGRTAPTEIEAAISSYAPVHRLRAGVLAGDPLGLTLAFALDQRFALHADIGPSARDRVRFIGAVDFTYWMPEVFGGDSGRATFVPWFGAGLRYSVGRNRIDHFGPRVPFGISYLVGEPAVEIFIEVVPGLGLLPDTLASLEGGFGMRVEL